MTTGYHQMPPVPQSTGTNPEYPTNLSGLIHALAYLQVDMRFNLRAGRAEIRLPGQRWRPRTQRHEAQLRLLLERSVNQPPPPRGRNAGHVMPWAPSRERWTLLREAYLFINEEDTFVTDYLEPLRKYQAPPGAPKLDDWLSDVFEFEGAPELVSWASRYLFLGVVQRSMEPGCQLDEIPVLVGAQGVGKSALVRAIVPPQAADLLFADDIDLRATPARLLEAVSGRAVIEVAEMIGAASPRHIEKIRAWISRRDDGATRRAYRADAEPAPRRFICVGTGNGRPLPADPTGNRRFVALGIVGRRAKTMPEGYLDRWRQALYAQALTAYDAGARANLPHGLADLQSQENARYESGAGHISDALEDVLPEHGEVLFDEIHAQVKEAAGLSALSKNVLAEGLRGHGFRYERTGQARRWIKQAL